MRAVVRAAFPAFNKPFEGRLPFMYLDVKGLVTTGVGNLIDPMADALGLPWRHKLDGLPATRAEIVADWNTVKAAQALRRLGGGHFAQLTKLYLDEDAIDALVLRRLDANEAGLRKGYPGWDSFPAPAQLAIHSMAWGLGTGRLVPGSTFLFPHFRAAANSENWATCAGPPGCADTDPSCRGEAWIEGNGLPGPNPANPGLHPRNLANRELFFQAAAGADPDLLVL